MFAGNQSNNKAISPKQILWYIVFIISITFYLVYSLPEILTIDSLSYAYSVREGENLFHPHHLIYNVTARGFYLLLQSVSPDVDAIFAMQLHNIIYAVLLVHVTFLFLRKTGTAFWRSVFGAATIAVSYELWRMTGACEVYVPSIFFSVWLLYYLYNADLTFNFRNSVLLPFILALSILYHQLGILLCPALFILGWMKEKKTGIITVTYIILTGGVITISAYLLAIWHMNIPVNFKSFYRFLFSYNLTGPQSWGTFKNFSGEGFGLLTQSLTSGIYPHNQNRLTAFHVFTWIILMVTATVAIRSVKNQLNKLMAGLLATLLIWWIIYILFIWWWIPGEWEFFITPSWILIFLLTLISNAKQIAAKVFVAIIFSSVIYYNIKSALNTCNKPWILKEETIKTYERYKGDYVLIDEHMEKEIVKYYINLKVININDFSRDIHKNGWKEIAGFYHNPKIIPVKYLEPDFRAKDYPYNVTDQSWIGMFYWLTCFEETSDLKFQSQQWHIDDSNGQSLFVTENQIEQFETEEEYRKKLKKTFESVNKKIELRL